MCEDWVNYGNLLRASGRRELRSVKVILECDMTNPFVMTRDGVIVRASSWDVYFVVAYQSLREVRCT